MSSSESDPYISRASVSIVNCKMNGKEHVIDCDGMFMSSSSQFARRPASQPTCGLLAPRSIDCSRIPGMSSWSSGRFSTIGSVSTVSTIEGLDEAEFADAQRLRAIKALRIVFGSPHRTIGIDTNN